MLLLRVGTLMLLAGVGVSFAAVHFVGLVFTTLELAYHELEVLSNFAVVIVL